MLRHRSALFDLGIVVILSAMAVASVVIDDDVSNAVANGYRAVDVWFWVFQAGQVFPLAVRRRWPTVVIAVTGMSIMFASIANYSTSFAIFGVLIALYTVAAYASRTDSLISLAISFVAILVSIAATFDGLETVVVVASNYVVFGTAWLLGDWVRGRREHMAALEERARRLEADRADAEERAARRERNRIARELHDVVAHSLSVMVIHAGAARRDLERDGDERSDRIKTIEDTGRATLAEMRHLLGRIRADDEDAPRAPQPGLTDLTALIDDFDAAGLDVELTLDVPDDTELASTVALSTYRIVQESLTNVLKHAGTARAAVSIGVDDDGIRIEVTDDGRGAAADRSEPGHGLVGIRERVGLFDGTLHAGPRVGGGWMVRARLPLQETNA